MKILPIQTNGDNVIQSTKTKKQSTAQTSTDSVSFKRIDYSAARVIENRFAAKGITMDVHGNVFVAECYEKTINIFKKLFKKSYLPAYVGTERFNDNRCLGQYVHEDNSVNVNRDLDNSVFYDMTTLKKSAKEDHNNLVLPNWASTSHPAHPFVHEFSHAAHWNHVKELHGYSNADDLWDGLRDSCIPSSIGRLITKFKISEYAAGTKKACNMCEFLAERMAQDICEGLTNNTWEKYKNIDVEYGNIFSRKWNYRYSSPQSYIDYFTQQVWNGDIDGANEVGEDAARYLAELEGQRVAPLVETASDIIETTGSAGSLISVFLRTASRVLTDKLDAQNKIKLNKNIKEIR